MLYGSKDQGLLLTNGFMNWGLGVGIIIFAGTVLTSFAMACVLRGVNIAIHKVFKKDE